MTAGSTAPSGRLASVDAWRFIAVVAVIAIHTTPEAASGATRWFEPSFLINQVARFAVPFFFVVSGYFWGQRVAKSSSVIATSSPTARRILVIFIVWTVIYALPYDVATVADGGPLEPLRTAWWHLNAQVAHPMTLLMQGTKSHLWFLVALLCALAISAVFVQYRWYVPLAVVAVLLYVVELLTKPYVQTPLGWSIDFNTRNGPFCGTIFFVTGFFLSRSELRPAWARLGMLMFFGGCCLHLAENRYLSTHLESKGFQDFVIGTYPMGVGAALIALSGRRFKGVDALARLGRDALGIYLVHAIFVDLFHVVMRIPVPLIGHLLDIALVLACSLIVVRLLSKSRHARMILM
jgi:surface polysaccharide O-acyltransferase-like enzyme